MEETRRRIATAGAEYVKGLGSWDWSDLTFRRVATLAGVGERTVYRHFPTERDLHAAVLTQLADEAGVDLEHLTLDAVADTADRVFRSLGRFGGSGRTLVYPDLPAMTDAHVLGREALLRVATTERPDWSERDQLRLAAALDVLWAVQSYERLVGPWGLAPDEASTVLSWAIRAVIDAPLPRG